MGKKQECKKGAPEWMTTFSDLMSLLLCFFVLLFSLSTIIIKKKVHALGNMNAAFGGLPAPYIVENIPDRHTQEEISRPTELQRKKFYGKEEILRMEEHKVKSKKLDTVIQVTGTEQGITFRLSGDLSFQRGSAELTAEGYRALRFVADEVNQFSMNPVKVSGHTDNTRRAGDADVNWQLAADRAYTAMMYLIQWGSFYSSTVDYRRFTYESFGEFHPLPHVDPDTEIGRRVNRRVEVTLIQTDQGYGTAFDESEARNPRTPLIDQALIQEQMELE